MKPLGAGSWTEVASLSKGDSRRRAKAFRSRARQGGRALCRDEYTEYLEELDEEAEEAANDEYLCGYADDDIEDEIREIRREEDREDDMRRLSMGW